MKGIFEKKDKFNFFAKRIKNFYGYPPLFHPHCEIFFVISGEIEMTVDGKAKTLKAGEISTVFPYTVHSYENAPDAELYMIMFEPDALGTFEAELLSKKPICPYLKSSAYLEPMFARAAEFMYDSDGVRSKLAVSYLSVIVGELLNTMPLQDTESLSENMIKPILLYCSEHFADEDISIKKIANELYISQSYVSKVFSTKLRYGFREYINELRISKAKKLLSKTDLKIVDIMLECGFKNQSSFNRIFSDICETSPSEYRTALKSKK